MEKVFELRSEYGVRTCFLAAGGRGYLDGGDTGKKKRMVQIVKKIQSRFLEQKQLPWEHGAWSMGAWSMGACMGGRVVSRSWDESIP